MTTNQELHVVFGAGPLGRATMNALLKMGKKVRLVNRSDLQGIPTEVEQMKGDAYSLDFTRQATAGAYAVYQCAQPHYHEWVTKFKPLQTAIMEGVASNNAKLIVGDNLYMYGDTDGKPLREDLPYAANTRKGKVRAEMADQLMSAHQAGKLRVAVGRGSDFYGPGVLESTLGDRVFYPMLAGKAASATGNIELPHTYTYIEDFGTGLAMLGQADNALGQTWHIPNAPTQKTSALLEQGYKIAGQPAKYSGMGKTMMWIGGLFIPGARETVEMMYEFEKPFVVDHSKFEKRFGNIATPLHTGLENTIEWYKAHPQTKS